MSIMLQDPNRMTIRATPNPLDKSTIVSIFPKPIDEVKHTIQPGRFIIEPGSYDKPAILVVGSSSWWKDTGDREPLLEIPHSSIQIADSVVKDYCNGYLACNMGDTMPGLFYIPGEFTVDKIKKDFKKLLDEALVKQRNWFSVLVRLADVLWARSNGNPLTISEDMRLAATELNLVTKDWIKDIQTMELIRCVACGTSRNPKFPICQTCKAIVDPVKAKELGLTFVQ